MREIVRIGMLAALVLAVGSQATASFVGYTDFASWKAAVDLLNGASVPILTEDFEAARPFEPWLDIQSDCEDAPGSTGCTWTDAYGVRDGLYYDRVVAGEPALNRDTLWTFADPVWGVAALWDTGVNTEGAGIDVFVDGVALSDAAGPNIFNIDGFFGWTSTTPFTEVRLAGFPDDPGDPASVTETYSIDDLQVAPVPEPGTLLLLGTGLTGLALRRRRRNR